MENQLFHSKQISSHIHLIQSHHFDSSQFQTENERSYLKLPIKDIPALFPGINWVDFVNSNLHGIHHVNENETVIFPDLGFLFKLQFYMPKRTTANYFAWRLIRMSRIFVSANLYQLHKKFVTSLHGTAIKPDSRPIECVEVAIE